MAYRSPRKKAAPRWRDEDFTVPGIIGGAVVFVVIAFLLKVLGVLIALGLLISLF